MQRIKWLLVAPVLALLLAATPGGFPSKPHFSCVGIGAGSTCSADGTLVMSNTLNITGGNLSVGAGASRLSCSAVLSDPLTVCKTADRVTKVLTVTDTTVTFLLNTHSWFFDGSGNLTMPAGTVVSDSAGTVWGAGTTGSSKGADTLNAQGLYTGGVRVPRISYGQVGTAVATCTLSGTVQSQNVGACAFNSAGTGTLTFATAYTTAPTCVASAISAGSGTTYTAQAFPTSTTVQVGAWQNGSAPTGPVTVAFACYGT